MTSISNTQTRILLIRHGETKWNQEQRFQGNLNSELTAQGILQAQRVREHIKSYSLSHIYVSPLQRAQHTLEHILTEQNLDIEIIEDLKEMNLGSWEGKTFKQVQHQNPVQFKHFWHQADLFNVSKAETFAQLQHRMVNALETIFKQGEHKTSLVVSHWVAIKVALAFYSHIPLNRLNELKNPKNGAIICLTKNNHQISIDRG